MSAGRSNGSFRLAAPAFGVALSALMLAMTILQAGAQDSTRQKPDLDFTFVNESPAYPLGQGPQILFSSRNSPFVESGLYKGLAKLAETDGFTSSEAGGPLSQAIQRDAAILVLINTYLPSFKDFPAMDPPSAFTDEEIEAVRQWVSEGGSLLILADHAPFGGGSAKLAEAFGFTFLNGHLVEKESADSGFVHVEIEFSPGHGLVTDHPITNGGLGRAPSKGFYTFGGQAFIPPDDGGTLLRVPQGWQAVFSYRISRELQSAPRIDASGMAQGAVAQNGKGRVAIFGETASFTAQKLDGRPIGFSSPQGVDNPEFILSVLRWLANYKTGN